LRWPAGTFFTAGKLPDGLKPSGDAAARIAIRRFCFTSSLDPQAILGSEDRVAQFDGGPVILARLSPVDYHHLHYPDDGHLVDEARIATGSGAKKKPGAPRTISCRIPATGWRLTCASAKSSQRTQVSGAEQQELERVKGIEPSS
jgi:Phosphatidylserine decarboxylase